MPVERTIQPAARPHTAWSRTQKTRETLLGFALIAAAAWGWSAWRQAERDECAAVRVRGTVETVEPREERTFWVVFKDGPAVEIPVETGRLVPRAGCRGRVCENGHWHVETADGEDF